MGLSPPKGHTYVPHSPCDYLSSWRKTNLTAASSHGLRLSVSAEKLLFRVAAGHRPRCNHQLTLRPYAWAASAPAGAAPRRSRRLPAGTGPEASSFAGEARRRELLSGCDPKASRVTPAGGRGVVAASCLFHLVAFHSSSVFQEPCYGRGLCLC